MKNKRELKRDYKMKYSTNNQINNNFFTWKNFLGKYSPKRIFESQNIHYS